MTFAFVVTTKTCTAFQTKLLAQCIQHIRAIYPTHTIYIINDNSPIAPPASIRDPHVHIYPALAIGAGELNAYLFALDPRCTHKKLVFIHDSVFLKKAIDQYVGVGVNVGVNVGVDKENEENEENKKDEEDKEEPFFLPLWQANQFVFEDLFLPINSSIFNNVRFYHHKQKTQATLGQALTFYFLRQKTHPFNVTFGTMAIFNRAFVKWCAQHSNLFHKNIVVLFTTRLHRCVLERIMTCLYIHLFGHVFPGGLCGDIFNHPAAFKNINVHVRTNHPFVKVWQGR